MAVIKHLERDLAVHLEPEHRIGRATDSTLKLDENYVSSAHAVVRWERSAWRMLDLRSKNGTFLDGKRLESSDPGVLQLGTRLGFGCPAAQWVVVDIGPPQTMLIDVQTRVQHVLGEGETLFVLPDATRPLATIYIGQHGQWCLDSGDEHRILRHGDVFGVEDHTYRLSAAEGIEPTFDQRREDPRPRIRHLSLHFSPSSDGRWVRIGARIGPRALRTEGRAHDPLLFILAQRRLADAHKDVPDVDCGWIDGQALAHALDTSLDQLNVLVFRLRRYFETLGFVDAGNIVERRPRQRLLRIGVPTAQLQCAAFATGDPLAPAEADPAEADEDARAER